MGRKAPPVDEHAVGAGFRHGAGGFHLAPVGVAVGPEGGPPGVVELVEGTIALLQPGAEGLLAEVAVAVTAHLVGQVPENHAGVVGVALRQAEIHLPHLAAVHGGGEAVVVPSAEVEPLIVIVHPQDFRVLLRHPGRARAAGGGQDDVNAALPQAVDHLVQPGEVIHAVLDLQARPGENADGHRVDVGLVHHFHIALQDVGAIQPLVGIIVAAVQEGGESGRKGHGDASS